MQETNRYTIREEIACGSTATVFLAEDGVLRRMVALKKLHPHLLNHAETVKRFEKEAVAVARISHENIIRVYDYGSEGRNLYLAMEYVDGATLESLLTGSGGALPARVCHALFHQLMKGLAAAHGIGVVHRDIKPCNLLVDRTGLVRIADFGIAFLAEEKNITKTGAYLGTPVYSAPEQAMCRPATEKSDIFSSGILFYRCLTGKLPFDGETSHAILSSILEKAPAKPSLVNPRVLPGFCELTLAMLAKDPAQRPTAVECLRRLEALAERHGLPIEAGRLRRFIADGRGYAAEEGRELGRHFLDLARAAEAECQIRQAVKLAALAEIHGPVPAESEAELRRIATVGKSHRRRRSLAYAGLALVLLAVTGAGLRELAAGMRSASEAVPTVPPATAPPIPIPVPAAVATPAAFVEPSRVYRNPDTAPAALSAAPASAPADLPRPSPAEDRQASRKAPPAAPLASPGPAVPEAATGSPQAAATGFLLVKTNPPFAKVSLDGKELGITPFQLPRELPTGLHALLIERQGCLPVASQVQIEPGRTFTLRLALDRAQALAR